MTDTLDLVKQINASIEGIKAENARINDALKTTGSADEVKAAVKAADESAKKVAEMSTRIIEIEQSLAENVKAGKASPQTLGEAVIKSDAYKAFANGNAARFRIEANTITGQTGSPPANSDVLVAPQRLSGIIPLEYRKLNIFDVLPSGVTTSNAIEVTRENSYTNSAAETAEGDTKPQSAITYNLLSVPVRTIATWLKVSKQVIEDSAMLQSHIDTRLRHMAMVRYQNQIISGNGTNQNISGILDSGNHTVFNAVSGENELDALNRMIEAVQVADYEPTAIMLNPVDFHTIERLKVGTSDDRYIVGNPAGMLAPTLWGLPVILSNSITSGTAIVGDFTRAYTVWNRQGAVVEMFEQDGTNVQQNLITVRSELRGCLASYVPAAVYAGALNV